MSNCINSSKVYCKLIIACYTIIYSNVLIVAKCIVNFLFLLQVSCNAPVLIVAKCIVNVATSTPIDISTAVLIVAKCIVNLHIYKSSLL